MQNCILEGEVKTHRLLTEVHEGGEVPHWTPAPSNKKKKRKKNEEEKEEEEEK